MRVQEFIVKAMVFNQTYAGGALDMTEVETMLQKVKGLQSLTQQRDFGGQGMYKKRTAR